MAYVVGDVMFLRTVKNSEYFEMTELIVVILSATRLVDHAIIKAVVAAAPHCPSSFWPHEP